MLRDHVTSSGVVVVLVHLDHLQCVHDSSEQDVVELNRLEVVQFRDMLDLSVAVSWTLELSSSNLISYSYIPPFSTFTFLLKM